MIFPWPCFFTVFLPSPISLPKRQNCWRTAPLPFFLISHMDRSSRPLHMLPMSEAPFLHCPWQHSQMQSQTVPLSGCYPLGAPHNSAFMAKKLHEVVDVEEEKQHSLTHSRASAASAATAVLQTQEHWIFPFLSYKNTDIKENISQEVQRYFTCQAVKWQEQGKAQMRHCFISLSTSPVAQTPI